MPEKPEVIVATGRIFEIVQLPQPDGRIFEVARRAPGVRLIIADNTKRQVLLSRESRRELGDQPDYRLPGGKLFDTLPEFEAFRTSGADIIPAAAAKVREEAAEEVGLQIHGVQFLQKSTLGTTVEWDLYVFEALGWQSHPAGQAPEAGEEGIEVGWYDYATAEEMILTGQMHEERIALILLQWLHRQAA